MVLHGWVLAQLTAVIIAVLLGWLSNLSRSPDLTKPMIHKLLGLSFNFT